MFILTTFQRTKNITLLFLGITLLLISCTNGTKKVADKSDFALLVREISGSYVNADYQNRDKGYDWVAVTISYKHDSTFHIRVRSRADIKRPTCTFDADATLKDQKTLQAWVEGKTIKLVCDGKNVTFQTDNADDAILSYFCSGGATLANQQFTKIKGQPDQSQIDLTIFQKNLNFNDYYFEVNQTGKELSVQPFGGEIDNSPMVTTIEGTVIGAEVGDLTGDGQPEAVVYIQSTGSGSYGTVIGYSITGKKLTEIYFPEMSEEISVYDGYMGHDNFALINNVLTQKFPIYKQTDTNANPTGKQRQVSYKIQASDSTLQFVIDTFGDR